MAGATEAPLMAYNNPKPSGQYNNQVTDMIFEFVEESELSSGSSFNSGNSHIDDNGDLNFEDNENPGDPEENKSFWESQEQLLTVDILVKCCICCMFCRNELIMVFMIFYYMCCRKICIERVRLS